MLLSPLPFHVVEIVPLKICAKFKVYSYVKYNLNGIHNTELKDVSHNINDNYDFNNSLS